MLYAGGLLSFLKVLKEQSILQVEFDVEKICDFHFRFYSYFQDVYC